MKANYTYTKSDNAARPLRHQRSRGRLRLQQHVRSSFAVRPSTHNDAQARGASAEAAGAFAKRRVEVHKKDATRKDLFTRPKTPVLLNRADEAWPIREPLYLSSCSFPRIHSSRPRHVTAPRWSVRTQDSVEAVVLALSARGTRIVTSSWNRSCERVYRTQTLTCPKRP